MKKTILLILFATISLMASAQLHVASDGKVKIASNQNTSYSNLLVGNYTYAPDYSNVGISGSTTIVGGKKNVGVLGTICADPSINICVCKENRLCTIHCQSKFTTDVYTR